MNEAEAKLVKALRSGKYIQTSNRLHTDDGYCCLGVACDVLYPEEPWKEQFFSRFGGNVFSKWGEHQYLPPIVKEELGWATNQGDLIYTIPVKDDQYAINSLLDLNDQHFPFEQIADFIEAGLVMPRNWQEPDEFEFLDQYLFNKESRD